MANEDLQAYGKNLLQKRLSIISGLTAMSFQGTWMGKFNTPVGMSFPPFASPSIISVI